MAVENVALIRKVKSKDHLPLADLFQVSIYYIIYTITKYHVNVTQ